MAYNLQSDFNDPNALETTLLSFVLALVLDAKIASNVSLHGFESVKLKNDYFLFPKLSEKLNKVSQNLYSCV